MSFSVELPGPAQCVCLCAGASSGCLGRWLQAGPLAWPRARCCGGSQRAGAPLVVGVVVFNYGCKGRLPVPNNAWSTLVWPLLRGNGCGQADTPGVYTSVPIERDWIQWNIEAVRGWMLRCAALALRGQGGLRGRGGAGLGPSWRRCALRRCWPCAGCALRMVCPLRLQCAGRAPLCLRAMGLPA